MRSRHHVATACSSLSTAHSLSDVQPIGAARQYILPLADELIVDLFAGGGGMSQAIEDAFGRHADIAINHNEDALSMHRVNHPQTRHFISDVFEIDPRAVTRGRPVGHLHLSPDCTHFSQAKGGQPRNARIRGLSWVGIRWCGQVRPRAISLENVKQLVQWGPLIAKRDPDTGRVITLDTIVDGATGKKTYRVAAPGEQVPVGNQYLVPDPRHAGRIWRRFLTMLRGLGYEVEYQLMVAADHGANTTRERLFLFARRDGLPITFPKPTHFKNPAPGQKKWPAAAECIDFSIPCPSIFERTRPLADATLKRIARGVKRYVLDAADPFIVPDSHQGSASCKAPTLLKIRGQSDGGRLDLPLPTITSGAGAARPAGAAHAMGIIEPLLVQAGATSMTAAFLAQQNTMPNGGVHAGHDLRSPMSTITHTGSQQNLITASLATLRKNVDGRSAEEPLSTITAGAEHHALVQYTLSKQQQAGALRCAALLIRYYGQGGQWGDLREPAHAITTRDRLALVTVWLKGEPYIIVDIGLRMLTPRELYTAQGFPRDYIIDRGHDGRVLSKSAQVRMCGNSVSRQPAAALLRSNHPDFTDQTRAVA